MFIIPSAECKVSDHFVHFGFPCSTTFFTIFILLYFKNQFVGYVACRLFVISLFHVLCSEPLFILLGLASQTAYFLVFNYNLRTILLGMKPSLVKLVEANIVFECVIRPAGQIVCYVCLSVGYRIVHSLDEYPREYCYNSIITCCH